MKSLILNLHGIGRCRRSFERDEERVWISKEMFDYLIDQISGSPKVRLTVDDGNESDVEIILPKLKEYGMSGSFFVLANKIDHIGYLSKQGVVELFKEGMTVGSHGLDHLNWRFLNYSALHEEVYRSKAILEDILGNAVEEVACPFGGYNRRVLKILKEAGFKKIYTSDRGYADFNSLFLPRNTIYSSWSENDIHHLVLEGFSLLEQCKISSKIKIKQWR